MAFKNKSVFLLFVSLIFLFACPAAHAEEALRANIQRPAESPAEHKPCIECFNQVLADLHGCMEASKEKDACAFAYQKAADGCKQDAICKVEGLQWSKEGDRPLGTGGIFSLKAANLAEAPLEIRKQMVREGARNVPLPELDAEEIKALEQEQE